MERGTLREKVKNAKKVLAYLVPLRDTVLLTEGKTPFQRTTAEMRPDGEPVR